MIFMNNCNLPGMKKAIVTLSILFLFPLIKISAQNTALEKLNAYKIAFFTRSLNLTTQEAEKFWPVYNEFQDKRTQIQQERSQLNRRINQTAMTMSDSQRSEAGDNLIALEVREANLSLEYHKKFKEILSPAKVLRLYQAENQYRQQLLNELRDNRPQQNAVRK
jgi:hypothetical protein